MKLIRRISKNELTNRLLKFKIGVPAAYYNFVLYTMSDAECDDSRGSVYVQLDHSSLAYLGLAPTHKSWTRVSKLICSLAGIDYKDCALRGMGYDNYMRQLEDDPYQVLKQIEAIQGERYVPTGETSLFGSNPAC
jgi:hypothetical protein